MKARDRRIYLVGAHSTGKTTLARWIAKQYKLPMITEVARSVLSEWEASLESLRSDVERTGRYQEEVFRRQVEAEHAEARFVSDRAFDNLAYAAEHTSVVAKIVRSQAFRQYTAWVGQGTVFFLRPDRTLLQADGVREEPMWEGVVRIDGMIKFMLESVGIDYLPISTPSMQERVRTVSFVLDRL